MSPPRCSESTAVAGPSSRTGPPFRWSASHCDRARPLPTVVSTTSPERPTALDSAWGTVPPPATSTRAVVGSGSSRYVDQALGIGGRQLTGLPHHDHPALDQEGRRRAGVDDRAHVELVDPGPAELLDHQGRVPSAHQLLGQGVGGLGHQRGVVPLTR